jgi:predicted MPP superfamily phosphohydrolase
MDHLSNNRVVWAATRATLESLRFKSKKGGVKSKSRWTLFERLLTVFELFLKLTGYYKKGLGNAMYNELTEVSITFSDLPEELEGYRIIHLSDLHLDTIAKTERYIVDAIKDLKYDLCVITGDYRKNDAGRFKHVIEPFKYLVDHLQAKDGIYAVLGNHDSYMMVDYEEYLSPLKFLVNEEVHLQKGDKIFSITGTDDPFAYYTDSAVFALEKAKGDFKLALVHTSELHDVASESKFNLYLCGHTHAGQVCLPGGVPLVTHQKDGKKFLKGLWKDKDMFGYTSAGNGVSGLPVRFNTFGEVVLITLNKK